MLSTLAPAQAAVLTQSPSNPGYLEVANAPALNPRAVTIACWFVPLGSGYEASDAFGAHLVSKLCLASCAGPSVAWILRWSPLTGLVNCQWTTSLSTSTLQLQSTSVIPIGVPCHAALALGNGIATLYLNGVAEASTSFAGDVVPNNGQLRIGAANVPGFARRFDGILDEVRLFDRALTEGDVASTVHCRSVVQPSGLIGCWSFDANNGTDSSGFGNHAAMHGSGLRFGPEPAFLAACHPTPWLQVDAGSIALQSGGTRTFVLQGGLPFAGAPYYLLGSLSGTLPGVTIGPRSLGLNPDAYLDLTLTQPNALFLSGSWGVLDAIGRGTAHLTIPPRLPLPAGITVHHAFVALDGASFDFSNPAPTTLRL